MKQPDKTKRIVDKLDKLPVREEKDVKIGCYGKRL